MIIKKSTINYLPVILTDSTDFLTAKTSVAFGAFTVNYAKQGDVALTTKVLIASDLTELGLGLYLIKFTATELSVSGLFYYVVNSAGCLDYYGCAEIQNTINDDMVDAVWDEVLTAATHNVASSAGRRLRQIGQYAVYEGTAQGPGTGTNQIQLDVGASATDDIYDTNIISIIAGTGIGQSRTVITYNGTTKIATVNRDWDVLPNATSEFNLVSSTVPLFTTEGLVMGSAVNTITLNGDASTVNDTYLGSNVVIVSGVGAGQSRLITGYVGATKVATVIPNWTTLPNTNSGYAVIPVGRSIVDSINTTATDIIVNAVWDEPKADHTGNTTMGDIATETDKIQSMSGTVDDIFDDVGDVEAKVDTVQATASAILIDTAEIQGKLPAEKIMGSAVTTSKDDEIDAIKLKTDLIPASPSSETTLAAVKVKTDLLPADPSSTASINAQLALMKSTTTGTYDRDTDSLEAIKDKVDTLVVSGELKNFNIAGK
ncbi:MAG: hypothetical protein PHP92_04915 [Candidatus Nanoarchaeia archaeon]|nr:hypothetical protein [Candidatus Nanoarchaeia archaeon]